MAKAAKTAKTTKKKIVEKTIVPEEEFQGAPQEIADIIDKEIVDKLTEDLKYQEVYEKIIEDFTEILEKENTIPEQPSEELDEVKKEEDIKDIQEFLVNVEGEDNATALKEATKIEEGLGSEGLTEETKKELKGLSDMAIKWRDYIKYIGFTPENFLKKYPTNKFKTFVEEIIEFNKNTDETNI